jgi:ubiquinone/menaquinone biosynthesis C-methylase UbiE
VSPGGRFTNLGDMSQGEPTYNAYDEFAQVYARVNETSPFLAHYERPAILTLAGEVRGQRVLDAGCGAGVQAAELVRRGATVTGVDQSHGMLALARERLGPDVPLRQADLARPLPFPDGAFDLVLASLVMHYLHEWEPTLREFRRVLVPRGRVVLSTHHPLMTMRVSGSDDYLGTYQYTEDWSLDGRTVPMRFWHRPLRAMWAAFTSSGFAVDEIVEPDPRPELAEVLPDTYQRLRRDAQFLFFSLTAGAGVADA